MNQPKTKTDTLHSVPSGLGVELSKLIPCFGRSAIRFGLALSLALTLVSNLKAQKDGGKLVEFWKGTLVHDGTDLEMGLKIFRMADGSLTAKFSSYSQGATRLACRI